MSNACAPFEPGERDLLDSCNLGYARSRCGLVNAGGPDCIRFAVASDTETSIGIRWVQEKDHLPYRHGSVELVPSSGELLPPPHDEVLAQQIRAYAASYMRRTRRWA